MGSAGQSGDGGMPAAIRREPITEHDLFAEPLPAGSTDTAGS